MRVTLDGSQRSAVIGRRGLSDAAPGLWLQPACQAAGLDVCSYIIKEKRERL